MKPWAKLGQRLWRSAQNAQMLWEGGDKGPGTNAPFALAKETQLFSLRHYGRTTPGAPVLLLIPPLMLTAEIYDIAPNLSAARSLVDAEVDLWIVDFRAPEHEAQGMTRTLDDHVVAVSQAIDHLLAVLSKSSSDVHPGVHLAGYSQGGMFAYQCAAYRKSKGIASVIAFGSPVDVHKSVPVLGTQFAGELSSLLREILSRPLDGVEGIPGRLSSGVFRALNIGKEVEQFLDLFRLLDDRGALLDRAARRGFLAGEGFVAWPGPALRTFVDEFIVANRMLRGGFSISSSTVSLTDIVVPILCVWGKRDAIAKPAVVRAIHEAAPNSTVEELAIDSGHFGLVVGTRAMNETWPYVAKWVQGEYLTLAGEHSGLDADAISNRPWKWLDKLAARSSQLRYETRRLREFHLGLHRSEAGLANILHKRAQEAPSRAYLLWKGRSYRYGELWDLITRAMAMLQSAGFEAGDRVPVASDDGAELIALLAACNAMGLVAILSSCNDLERQRASLPSLDTEALNQTPGLQEHVCSDPNIVAFGMAGAFGKEALVDNAYFSAQGLVAAAAGHLCPEDTVYCANPGQDTRGLLVAIGASLSAQARLALPNEVRGSFIERQFWIETLACGASVALYSKVVAESLSGAHADKAGHPLRLLLGYGLSTNANKELRKAYPAIAVCQLFSHPELPIYSFQAGACLELLGTILSARASTRVVRFNPVGNTVERGFQGQLLPVFEGQYGLLLARKNIVPKRLRRKYAEVEMGGEERETWYCTTLLLKSESFNSYRFVGTVASSPS